MDLFNHLLNYLPKEEVEKLRSSLDLPSVHALFLNPKVISDEKFLSLFPQARPHPFLPQTYYFDKEVNQFGKSLFFDIGAYYIQDASAALPIYFLNPQPGDKVLDMCAAPGGKAIRAALMMQDQGVIVANDVSYRRIGILNNNIRRFGLINTIITMNDMLSPYPDYDNYFDKIILDAPCSGSGMIRKEPKMLADWSLGKMEKMVEMQHKLLQNAINLVKTGGLIVYATCSYCYEENEAVIKQAINTGDVEIVPLPEVNGSWAHPDLPGSLRFHHHHNWGEGQFVCLLKKKRIEHQSHKIHKNPNIKAVLPFAPTFDLSACPYFISWHQNYFGVSTDNSFRFLNVVRHGLHLGLDAPHGFTYNQEIVPYLEKTLPVEVDQETITKYIQGEELSLSLPPGWHILSYLGLRIGLVHQKDNRTKNHYPKGMRRPKLLL